MLLFEFMSLASTLMIAASLFLIAMSLFQGLMIYRRQMRQKVWANTHSMVNDALQLKEDMHTLIREMKGKEIASGEENANPELIQRIRKILNACEQISLGIRHGLFEESVVRESFAKLFVLFYPRVEKYILELRYEMNDPELFSGYSYFVRKWQTSAIRGRHHE